MLNKPEEAAITIHKAATILKRETATAAETRWDVSYLNDFPAIDVWAATDSRCVLVFVSGENVFCTGRMGQIITNTPGQWEQVVALLCSEAQKVEPGFNGELSYTMPVLCEQEKAA